jgi:antitoxin component YwqK of YwqJK toxin-antitoxin module
MTSPFMKNIILIFLLIFTTSLASSAQNDEAFKDKIVNKVNVEINDTLIQFYAVEPKNNSSPVFNQLYFWYKDDTILHTMGGYSGRLLNGVYQVFYPNKNLKDFGQFNYGSKTGVWRSWYSNGIIKEICNWKRSKKNGSFTEYDSNGLKTKYGAYKSDKLNGTITDILPDGKAVTVEYKMGVIVANTKENDGNEDNN